MHDSKHNAEHDVRQLSLEREYCAMNTVTTYRWQNSRPTGIGSGFEEIKRGRRGLWKSCQHVCSTRCSPMINTFSLIQNWELLASMSFQHPGFCWFSFWEEWLLTRFDPAGAHNGRGPKLLLHQIARAWTSTIWYHTSSTAQGGWRKFQK